MKYLGIVIATIIGLLSGGCVVPEIHHEKTDYPTEWGLLDAGLTAKPNSCPNISGTYNNETSDFKIVQQVRSSALFRYLSNIFFPDAPQEEKAWEITVTLNQQTDSLISIETSNGSQFLLDASQGDFKCISGAVEINRKLERSWGIFASHANCCSANYRIYVSEDDSLVVKTVLTHTGSADPNDYALFQRYSVEAWSKWSK